MNRPPTFQHKAGYDPQSGHHRGVEFGATVVGTTFARSGRSTAVIDSRPPRADGQTWSEVLALKAQSEAILKREDCKQAEELHKQFLAITAPKPGEVVVRSLSPSDIAPHPRECARRALELAEQEYGLKLSLRWYGEESDDDREDKAAGQARYQTWETDKSLLGYYRHTEPGVIYVKARGSVRSLVRTIFHEAHHGWQHARYGPEYASRPGVDIEAEAYQAAATAVARIFGAEG